MKIIIRSICIFFVVFFFTLKLCYCDYKPDIELSGFDDIIFYEGGYQLSYTDISECSLQNHLVIKRVSTFRRFINVIKFMLSIGWGVCGGFGFLWLLWAIIRLYTGGATDHD